MIGVFMVSCNNSESKKNNIKLKYPITKKVDTVTNYFGTEIKDAYRWLEDDMSEETANWVKDQNTIPHLPLYSRYTTQFLQHQCWVVDLLPSEHNV